MAIMALYTGNINALVAMAQQMNNSMFTAGIGMSGGGGYGGMSGGGYGMNGGMNGGMSGGYGNFGGSGYGGFSGGGYSGSGGISNQSGGIFSQGTTASGASAGGRQPGW
jgi:hypothetical protein